MARTEETTEVDTFNKYMVGLQGRLIVTLLRLPRYFTPDEAMLLAAYLVSLAEMDANHPFETVLAAVQSA